MGYGQGNPEFVYLPHWEYLGGTKLTGANAQQDVPAPSSTHAVEIRAVGGPVYWGFEAIVGLNSGGYIPEDGIGIIGAVGPLINFARGGVLKVWIATGTSAHCTYFAEHAKRK